MSPTAATARVLVASDNQGDAQQILHQLERDFEHVRASTDPDRAVQDFDAERPDVLVLAFDTLDKAQRYHLDLYRLGKGLHAHRHRTVILCNKDEVRAVFELCKKEYFDDYVLYRPHTHDGPRLAMSIWRACREMTALQGSVAPQSASALGQLRCVQPDVILLDIRLPGQDGLSLTRQLKASPRLAGVAIIMMTGDARRETLVSSMEAGAARDSLQVNLDKILLPR